MVNPALAENPLISVKISVRPALLRRSSSDHKPNLRSLSVYGNWQFLQVFKHSGTALLHSFFVLHVMWTPNDLTVFYVRSHHGFLHCEINTVGVLKRTALLMNPRIRFAVVLASSHYLPTFTSLENTTPGSFSDVTSCS